MTQSTGNNMFKFLNRKNPPTKAFVTLSLLLLFIFLLLLLYFMGTYGENSQSNRYLNRAYSEFNAEDLSQDPYITYFGENSAEDFKLRVTKYDPKYGPEDTGINIIYFGDYTCQYCLEQVEMIKGVVDERDDTNLIWKDYPDDNINNISWKAALAGRCAQSQNKFWEFLDLYSSQYPTFSAQSGLSTEQFDQFILGLAEGTELNMGKFRSCYNNLEHSDVLAASLVEARALKLPGVPYTYINERELLGEFDRQTLLEEIDRSIER